MSPTGRTPFVVLVMCLLAVGLVATLWLSTSAAADSYRLQEAHAAVADLTAQSERLRRDVAGMKSPTALAARAAELGMVPAEDPARIVVAEDGEVTVVGDPKPARAPAPPAPPADPAPADGAAPPPGTDPAEPGAPPLAEGTAPTGDTAAPGAGDDTAEPDAGAAEAPDPDSG